MPPGPVSPPLGPRSRTGVPTAPGPRPGSPAAPAPRSPAAPVRPAPPRTDADRDPAGGHHPLRIPRPHKKWQTILAVLGVFALLTVCGLASYFIVLDERAGTDAQSGAASAAPSVLPRDITSREVDPAPLTEAEVFPSPTVMIVAGQPGYPVLKTQASADCRIAATEDLSKQVLAAGCTQFVRGTLKSPTGEYLITTGIFNLATESGAEKLYDSIKGIVDAKKGRFTGLLAGAGTEPIVRSSTHLGWDVRGHYLFYCVIARSDGKASPDTDPRGMQIIYDMLTLHMDNQIIENRATVRVGASAAPS